MEDSNPGTASDLICGTCLIGPKQGQLQRMGVSQVRTLYLALIPESVHLRDFYVSENKSVLRNIDDYIPLPV